MNVNRVMHDRLLTGTTAARRAGLVAGAFWVVLLAALALRRLVVTLDSMNSYAHVWWIADRLHHGAGLPYRMPVLGHGRALTYPYSFVPWTAAALGWLAIGEHAVSVALALGGAALVIATFFAFPELRSGWWAALTLANPTLLMAPLAGQLPFEWAAAALLAAIGAWRRGRVVVAVMLAALAQATHPGVVGPMAAAVVACWYWFEPDRRRLLAAWVTATVFASPAIVMMALAPIATDSSTSEKAVGFIETFAPRAFVVIVPVGLALARRYLGERPGTAFVLLAVAANAALFIPLQMDQAWVAPWRAPDPVVLAYTRSPDFAPGAEYRVLRGGDEKVGMYQLLRAGARLDSEFFPESIGRRSFPSTAAYARFLIVRRVDKVMIFTTYDRDFHTNERTLLERLASSPCGAGGIRATLDSRGSGYTVYGLQPSHC